MLSIALVIGGIVHWLAGESDHTLVRILSLSPLRPLAASAPAKSTEATADASALITKIDPRFEVCSHPEWSLELAAVRLGAEGGAYLQRQTEDLRQAATATLLRPAASEQQRLAGLLLRGETAEAAKLVANSADGKAYGVAWRACQNEAASASAACSALSLERWAQLEPDNAAPWLAMVSVAHKRGDASQAIDAMHRAGLARELDNGWGWLTNQAMAALPLELPESGELGLRMELVGLESGWLIAQGNGATRYCRKEALADANTRQQCEAVARVMMTRASTLIDAAIGMSMGKGLGLSGERTALTREQIDAVAQWRVDQMMDQLQRLSMCQSTRAIITDMRESARIGEWPAMQAAMKAARASSQPLSLP